MKKMSSICFIFLLTLFMLNSQSPAETTLININFENMAPGVKPTNFLADYGITDMVIGGTGSTAGPPAIIDLSPYPNHHAPSPYNVFRQHLYCGGSYPPYPACNQSGGPTHSLTMFFTPELVSFGLSRLGTSGGASTSIWRAYFYNSSNTLLGSFGESSNMINAPIKSFSFSAPAGETIASMTLTSWHYWMTHRNIPVDNFVLLQALDSDGDGIIYRVDGYMDDVLGYIDESIAFSYDFTDENIDGTSFGYIKPGSGPKIIVDDAPFPDGLQVSASGGGTGHVRVCDISPPDGRIELTDGDSIIVTCGSMEMEVVSGPVELLLDDDNVKVIVGAGAVILITESENGQLQIENQSAGGIPVEVIVDGVSIELAPGEDLQSTAIDILPADPENCINVKKKGKIPIAVFGSNDLDVTQIDPATCELEDTLGVCTKGKAAIPMASIKDVDLDGIDDLVLQFEVQEGFFNDQTSATVTCELLDENGSVSGYDIICTVP